MIDCNKDHGDINAKGKGREAPKKLSEVKGGLKEEVISEEHLEEAK